MDGTSSHLQLCSDMLCTNVRYNQGEFNESGLSSVAIIALEHPMKNPVHRDGSLETIFRLSIRLMRDTHEIGLNANDLLLRNVR